MSPFTIISSIIIVVLGRVARLPVSIVPERCNFASICQATNLVCLYVRPVDRRGSTPAHPNEAPFRNRRLTGGALAVTQQAILCQNSLMPTAAAKPGTRRRGQNGPACPTTAELVSAPDLQKRTRCFVSSEPSFTCSSRVKYKTEKKRWHK